MATYELTATKPIRGQNPYWTYAQSGILGTQSVRIYAGKLLQIDNIWQPVHIDFTLTTDATVANRNMRVRHGIKGATLKSVQSVAVTASLTKKMEIVPMGESFATDVGLDSDYDMPLMGKDALVMFGEDGYLEFDINTGKAGDSWLFHVVLKYMNYELGMGNYSGNGSPDANGGVPHPRFD